MRYRLPPYVKRTIP